MKEDVLGKEHNVAISRRIIDRMLQVTRDDNGPIGVALGVSS